MKRFVEIIKAGQLGTTDDKDWGDFAKATGIAKEAIKKARTDTVEAQKILTEMEGGLDEQGRQIEGRIAQHNKRIEMMKKKHGMDDKYNRLTGRKSIYERVDKQEAKVKKMTGIKL